MRIAFLIDSLDLGGAERMAVSIANSLQGEIGGVSLITMRHAGPLQARIQQGINFFPLHKTKALDIKAFLRLRHHIQKGRFNYIHAHSSTIIWALLLKWSGCEVKVIWHDHFGGKAMDVGLFRNLIKKFSFAVDYVISVNQRLQGWAELHFRHSKIICLDNFPDLRPRELSRKEQVLLLANFRPQKDHANFLMAMKILRDQHQLTPAFCLVGALVDATYVDKVRSTLSDLSMTEQCIFFGPAEESEEFLYSSQIGVLSSKSEGLPVSLLEYGLAGLIPVSTRVGDCARVIADSGYLIDPENPEQLAEAIYQALKNPEAKQKARAFHQKILNEYSADVFKTKYLQFLAS